MNIKKLLVSSILSFLIAQPVCAKSMDTETAMFNLGYKSVYDAVEESNRYFGQEIRLPNRLPPVPFTHVFGRLNKFEDKGEGSPEIEYLNENTSPYTITVLKDQKMNLTSAMKYSKAYTLSDGSKAYYHDLSEGSNPHRIYFYFKKNNLN